VTARGFRWLHTELRLGGALAEVPRSTQLPSRKHSIALTGRAFISYRRDGDLVEFFNMLARSHERSGCCGRWAMADRRCVGKAVG
jgi:hypothetical protein